MATTKNKTELFDTFVGNVANHASNLRTQKGKIRMAAVWDQEMVEFFVEQKGDTSDVWDQCWRVFPDGRKESLGNRCAMISLYAQLCADALRVFMQKEEEAVRGQLPGSSEGTEEMLMIGRRIRVDGREGVVSEWEPCGSAMCDARVEFDDGSVCWYGSSDLRPVDGQGPLPSREEARRVADEVALLQLRSILADLVREVKEHKRWVGCEFGKALVGRGIDGAIADVESRLRRS